MNSRQFSRLSIGITYRFNIKKALLSQLGALAALVITIISEGHPPFGDEPYRLISGTSILVLVNFLVFLYTIVTVGSTNIKLFPSMLIYSSRGKQTRLDFSRIMHVFVLENKSLEFIIMDASGKESVGLKIKNYAAYDNSNELMDFLKYLLKDKISKSPLITRAEKKNKAFDIGSKNRYRI